MELSQILQKYIEVSSKIKIYKSLLKKIQLINIFSQLENILMLGIY